MLTRQSVTDSPILGKWNIIAVLLVAATLVATDVPTTDEISDAMAIADAPNFFCGKRITVMMANYCNPEVRRSIENRRTVKKSISPLLTSLNFNSFDVDQAASFNYDEADALLADPQVNDLPHLLSYLAASRRRRAITDECCRKPCTLRQLVAFCPAEYMPGIHTNKYGG